MTEPLRGAGTTEARKAAIHAAAAFGEASHYAVQTWKEEADIPLLIQALAKAEHDYINALEEVYHHP